MRNLAKKIVKEDNWKEAIKNIDNNIFEEVLLQGFIIGYSKIDIDEKLEYINQFIPNIDSWGISDTFCSTLKIKEKDLEKVWNFISLYSKSNKEFDIRFAVVMMLDYYITDKYVDKVIKKLDKISHDGYYVKMAVAWCIAEIGVKYNEKAMTYLQSNNNLDKFTYSKALQKMQESYRINNEQKEILKKLKRMKKSIDN